MLIISDENFQFTSELIIQEMRQNNPVRVTVLQNLIYKLMTTMRPEAKGSVENLRKK
jgi:hypothetical protein